MKKIKNGDKVVVDHSKFINKDGYRTGGVEVEMTNPQETQTFAVKGPHQRVYLGNSLTFPA